MKENLTKEDVTQDVKSAANAYLVAKAFAVTMRSSVDEIQRAILAECPIHNRRDNEVITNPKDDWLCDDEAELQDYWDECDVRLRAAGLKPADMPKTHCPALVAEHIVVEASWLIEEAAADMMEMGFDGKELNHRLLCMGLEKRQEFLDTIIGLVVNLPDYQPPKMAEVA